MDSIDFENMTNREELSIDLSDNNSIGSSFEILDYYCSPTPPTSPTLNHAQDHYRHLEMGAETELLYAACRDDDRDRFDFATDSPLITPLSLEARNGSTLGYFQPPPPPQYRLSGYHDEGACHSPPTIVCRYGGVDPQRVQMQLLDALRNASSTDSSIYQSDLTCNGSGQSSSAVGSLGLGEISTLQNCEGLREQGNNDWIWNWSSHSDVNKEHRIHTTTITDDNIFNRITRSLKGKNDISMLIVSHACSFFIGATCMLIYLRRCWRMSTFAVDI